MSSNVYLLRPEVGDRDRGGDWNPGIGVDRDCDVRGDRDPSLDDWDPSLGSEDSRVDD